jgi:alpha-tubulin suppressor-like RCC1 family protein
MRVWIARTVRILLLGILVPACSPGAGGTLTPTTAPGIPSDLQARPGNRSATLSWTASAAGSRYTVLRSLTSSGPFFPVSVPGQFQKATTYVDPDLINGTPYFYQVAAENQFGTSAPSSIVSVTPGFFAKQISTFAGGGQFLALLEDNTIWQWGPFGLGSISDVPFQIPNFTDVSEVSVGENQILALTGDGRVWVWGDDMFGQHGDGTTGSPTSTVPALVPGLSGAVAVSSGAVHCLALLADGTVWAWGRNDKGQLGQPLTTATNAVPLQVPGLPPVIAISAGTGHNLALTADGLVWAWGWNQYGQLANGAASTTSVPTPAMISSLTSVTSITAGDFHSMVLRADATLWTWGSNRSGEMGNGLTSTTPVVSPVEVPGLSNVVAIGSGEDHSMVALADGSVWAWGANQDGQLGLGTSGTTTINSPTLVTSLKGIVAVAGSITNSMAMGSNGSVWMWGSNANGELGNGTGVVDQFPLEVANFTGVTGVSAGGTATVALRSDGTAWSWGGNVYGEQGNGTSQATGSTFVPAKIPSLSGVVSLSSGGGFEMAILSNGSLWAWGINNAGQIGNNSPGTNALSPVQVLTQVTSIAAGAGHSLAIRSDGTLWSWGLNDMGQLGTGTFGTNLAIPTQITTLSAVRGAAAGPYHGLAVLMDGTVWAWGDNSVGELGQPTSSLSNSVPPVRVLGLPTVTAVAAGGYFSLALATDGSVWAWGANHNLQLGTGPIATAVSTPTQITDLAGVIAIAGGQFHGMALRSDGTVWAWGDNSAGQLGTETPTLSSTPVQVFGLKNISSISAGPEEGFAVGSDGVLWGWGINDFNVLGAPVITQSTLPVEITH